MRYVRVRWTSTDPSDPVLLYSELNDERWEVRKVEVYLDGSCGWASPTASSGDTMLGLVPVPELREIASDPQFDPEEISKAEFDSVWARCGGHG